MAIAAAFLRRSSRRLVFVFHPRPLSTQSDPNPNPIPNPQAQPLAALHSAIKSESDPDRIAHLFQSSAHLPGFYSDCALCDLTLRKLSKLQRPDLIVRILSSQRSDPKSPKSEGFLTRLLALYSYYGLLDHAIRLFDEIPKPTSVSISAILSALLKHKEYDLAIEKFHQLREGLGSGLGLQSYSLYLKALCGRGDVGTARKVLDEMAKSQRLAPDIVCYNAILHGFSNDGNEEGFNEVLKLMLDRGLEPNAFTYNCRIWLFCNMLQSSRGEEIQDVMASKGLQPNRLSFNAVIKGYCKEGDVESAVRVFKKMKVMKRKGGKDGMSPSWETYVMLIRSLVEKGEFGVGVEICRECLEGKFAPPFEVVKELIEGLAKDAKFMEAKDIVEKMNLVVEGEAVDAWKKIVTSLPL